MVSFLKCLLRKVGFPRHHGLGLGVGHWGSRDGNAGPSSVKSCSGQPQGGWRMIYIIIIIRGIEYCVGKNVSKHTQNLNVKLNPPLQQLNQQCFPNQFQLSIGLWVSRLPWSASFCWSSPHCSTKIHIPLISVQKLWSFMGFCKGAEKAATESCWIRKLWQQFSNQNVTAIHMSSLQCEI